MHFTSIVINYIIMIIIISCIILSLFILNKIYKLFILLGILMSSNSSQKAITQTYIQVSDQFNDADVWFKPCAVWEALFN